MVASVEVWLVRTCLSEFLGGRVDLIDKKTIDFDMIAIILYLASADDSRGRILHPWVHKGNF